MAIYKTLEEVPRRDRLYLVMCVSRIPDDDGGFGFPLWVFACNKRKARQEVEAYLGPDADATIDYIEEERVW